MALPGYPANPGGSQTMGGPKGKVNPLPGTKPGYPTNPGGSQTMGGQTLLPYHPGDTANAPDGSTQPAANSLDNPALFPGGKNVSTPSPAAPAANPLADFANSPLGLALKLGMSGANPQASNAYLSQFQSSLAGARSDIAHQLAGALQDINQNKAYAQAALNQLPAGINSAYGQAATDINHVVNGANAAVKGEGLAQAPVAANMGGGSLADYMAPEQAALATEKGANLANVPLLGVGIQQAGAQAAAAANNGALGDYSALDQQAASLANQNAIAQAQIAASQQQQNQGYLQSIGLAGINNAAQLQAIKAQAAIPSGSAAGGIYANTGLSQAGVQAAQANPDYTNTITAFQQGKLTPGDLQLLQRRSPTSFQVISAELGSNPRFTQILKQATQ